jgi:hypothetical protein
LPAALHYQFATYGNQSQTTWRGVSFINEAFIFYLLRSSNFFIFYFPQTPIPTPFGVGIRQR